MAFVFIHGPTIETPLIDLPKVLFSVVPSPKFSAHMPPVIMVNVSVTLIVGPVGPIGP